MMKPLHVIVLARPGGGRVLRGPTPRAGDVLPGIVGGILAAVLVFVVILRFEQQSEARRRDRR